MTTTGRYRFVILLTGVVYGLAAEARGMPPDITLLTDGIRFCVWLWRMEFVYAGNIIN